MGWLVEIAKGVWVSGLGIVLATVSKMDTEASTRLVLIVVAIYATWIFLSLRSTRKFVTDDISRHFNKFVDMSLFNLRQTMRLALDLGENKLAMDIARKLESVGSKSVKDDLEIETRKMNPLTKIELDRLKGYVDMVRNARELTLHQAQDFDNLSNKLLEESKTDSSFGIGVIILSAIAGFLLGALSNKD